jgi:integrase
MVGSASGKQVDSLMMRGVVEYNPASRARPPRLVRESSHTPVFEEAEIVAFLDSINLESLKDIWDKAIFNVLFYSGCRVSVLINLSVADYERGSTRCYGSKKNEGKSTRFRCTRRLKKRSIFGLNALTWLQSKCSTFSLLCLFDWRVIKH